MSVVLDDELNLVVATAGLLENSSLLAMHLAEIEGEAETVLELLTVARTHAYRGDGEATEETLAELTISFEHLLHHLQTALPEIQRQLDLSPEELTAA